jgi:hypothetical protein
MFVGQVLHFGIGLFLGLACLAAAWLYFDAWTERHHISEGSLTLGFVLLTIGFLMSGVSWDSTSWTAMVAGGIKLGGYLGIALGNLLTPIQPRPKTANPFPATANQAAGGLALGQTYAVNGLLIALPAATFSICLLYWHRAYPGLERHLKPLALVFLILTLGEACGLAQLWRHTTNPLVQPIIAPLGLVWILQHVAYVMAAGVLAWWVWHYLTKRLLSQLFLTITAFTFAIVLVAITSVSALMLKNLEQDALAGLETTGKVMTYAISAQTAATRTNAQVLAASPTVAQAIAANNQAALITATAPILTSQQLADVIVTNNSGVVLSRASDPDRSGDSLTNEALVQHALSGVTVSSVNARRSVLGATVTVATASPVLSGGQLIGLILTSSTLDNSFADKLKTTTGLDIAILSGNTRSASTLLNQDGTTRAVGTTETNRTITKTVLTDGKSWTGSASISGQTYLATYVPVKDIDNTTVGMLFVGQPQTAVLSGARQAVSLTFLGAAIALVVITLPVYLIARQISLQLK